ncbi:MAG TPA: hypothetical protein VFW06_05240 [Acidimicrobiia bacterium]|nr:hypothetical protein [Acidimicrobiia bacterium]
MEAIAAAGAGFLLAVLWFDLMFDVQARGPARDDLPEAVLASIAGYYRRVTTDARPMNLLVGTAMGVTLVSTIIQIAADEAEAWAAWGSLVLVMIAIAVATTRTVPSAVRLGTRADTTTEQSRLARTILRQHQVIFVLMATTLALQIASALWG